MDTAVLTSYGWVDLLPKCSCEFLLDYEDEESESGAEESSGRKKKKPWRYRWPDEIRDEVLARLLKLNAERAEEERLAGVAATKTTKSRKKLKEPKTASSGEMQRPQGLRFPAPSPEIYSVNLVTALLSARPNGLPWPVLRDAFAAATRPTIMRHLALPADQQRVEEWSRDWKEGATPANLIPALRTMTAANVDVEGTGIVAVFALQDGPKEPATEFVAYDAWLALHIVEQLTSPVLPPDETQEIDMLLASIPALN
jgi:hypothetical protein